MERERERDRKKIANAHAALMSFFLLSLHKLFKSVGHFILGKCQTLVRISLFHLLIFPTGRVKKNKVRMWVRLQNRIFLLLALSTAETH